MIKKITQLSKIFIKDYFQNLYIFKKDSKKINKKSSFTWLLVIVAFVVMILSFKIINLLNNNGQAIIFFKIYFPMIATIFVFQTIFVCINVFFFSRDLEYILPLPIKPIELLIAKFNNVISMTYSMELLFLALPLLIYGIIVEPAIAYYITSILVLILFPIFLVTVISILMLFFMQLSKFIRNKDIFQIIIVAIMCLIMVFAEIQLINLIFNDNIVQEEIETEDSKLRGEAFNNRLDKLNSYFVIINPCVSLLTNFNIANIFFQVLKLIFISILSFLVFVFFGKILHILTKIHIRRKK